MDGDGQLEIIVGENTGKVYGFEIDGSPVAGFPLFDATYTIYSSPLLADLDLDGHLELLVGCNDTKIYCWDLGPGTHDPELLPWPQWRRDAVNNARMDRPACPGDLDGDGEAGQSDLGILLADWGCDDPVNGCEGDLNGDDKTDQSDLGILLADWGCNL